MRPSYARAIPRPWRQTARIFVALGDPHRQRIVLMFEPGERLTVGQIVAASTLSRSAVAHHLKVLREAGVLRAQKVGKEVWYRDRSRDGARRARCRARLPRRGAGVNRRRFLGATAAIAAAFGSGCQLAVSDGIFNACHARMPERLATHALVAAAWRGLDASRVWDVHCHVFGNGDGNTGLWINPAMERIWQPYQYLQRLFYLNAGCVHDAPGQVDESVVDRLLNQCEAMAPGFRALLFAFDWARDEAGAPDRERSTFHVPDEYAARLADALSAAFRVGGVDPSATIRMPLDRLEAAVAGGARAVKWLPSAQAIDPASARCDRFYAKLVDYRLPLIAHAGDERAVRGFGEDLGNPLRLRRPLDAGVRVVVAHCASLGIGRRPATRPARRTVPNFELFARLMDEPRYDAQPASATSPPSRRGTGSTWWPRCSRAATGIRVSSTDPTTRCQACCRSSRCRGSSSAGCSIRRPWCRRSRKSASTTRCSSTSC